MRLTTSPIPLPFLSLSLAELLHLRSDCQTAIVRVVDKRTQTCFKYYFEALSLYPTPPPCVVLLYPALVHHLFIKQ